MLNLPGTVTKSGENLNYIYDASGQKLRKVYNGVARDYVSGNSVGDEKHLTPNSGSYKIGHFKRTNYVTALGKVKSKKAEYVLINLLDDEEVTHAL